MALVFLVSHFHPFCLLAGNLLPDFQIALTQSILKLKSILMPPDKMSRNGEKNALVENLIWCILTALKLNLKTPNLLKDLVYTLLPKFVPILHALRNTN